MQVVQSISALSSLPGPLALAVGVFDGVHLGHQEVIRAAQEHAAQHCGTAVVVTFSPHPLRVLRPEAAPSLLCGEEHQRRLLAELGIQCLLSCHFTPETARTPAADFIRQLVASARPLGCISVGHTWTFGHRREGNIHLLMDLGQQHDFAVYGVPPLKIDATVVSSTLIREAVAAGDFTTAARYLGRAHTVMGTVVQGQQLGRRLGFPTANLALERIQLPPNGVYAVQARIANEWLPAVANLGHRPTVGEVPTPVFEVHIPGWQGNLYDQHLEVRFSRYLRAEQKFSGIDELKAQIQRDVAAAIEQGARPSSPAA